MCFGAKCKWQTRHTQKWEGDKAWMWLWRKKAHENSEIIRALCNGSFFNVRVTHILIIFAYVFFSWILFFLIRILLYVQGIPCTQCTDSYWIYIAGSSIYILLHFFFLLCVYIRSFAFDFQRRDAESLTFILFSFWFSNRTIFSTFSFSPSQKSSSFFFSNQLYAFYPLC